MSSEKTLITLCFWGAKTATLLKAKARSIFLQKHAVLLTKHQLKFSLNYYFLCSICLKTPCSRPSCLKVCWLTVKVKAVLSSWVNGLSAPQNGKSGWGKPLRLKNDIHKKAQIFDSKKQAKSLILAPESSFFTQIWIFLCSGQLLAKIRNEQQTELGHQILSWKVK